MIILKDAFKPDSLIESLERELSNIDHCYLQNDSQCQKSDFIFYGDKAHLKKLDNKSIWILHSKENIKLNIFQYYFMRKWKYQIRNITQKVNLKIGKIKSIASFLTPHTKNAG